MDDPEPKEPTGKTRWVARLTPLPGGTVEALLHLPPLGVDLWHRQEDTLVVAASEAQLAEIERRRLAHVERLATVDEYLERARADSPDQFPEGGS